MSLSRRAVTRALAVTGTAALTGSAAALPTAAAAAERDQKPGKSGETKGQGPVVRHTGKSPTGYEVTFRYYAPKASRVQLKGEWYFERPSTLSPRLTTPDQVVESQGLLPRQWQPGDVPISHPNSTSPNWPVVDMDKGRDGVWTYTTPLPSGVYTYGFFVDAQADDTTTTGLLPDPGNPA
ncbi:hypothetical protein AB0G32_37455 [Streptomyces sp. NPDC023723]|uniref:hypothetical protein n=1 Tax=Streptomyces sp. NPDC023723 TaxID=3154323 RepID=UPI0033EAE048